MPTLRFTPYAWSKLLYLRDLGDTEVGGFGISADGDLFLIEDFRLIEQNCTQVSVQFEDEAVADFFDEQIDQARQPEQVGRIWCHTHPGDSAEPSSVDEDTFARVFGQSNWSVMFILAMGGQTYARLKFGCGPGAEILVPIEIAWDVPFAAADHDAWEEEYDRCVKPIMPQRPRPRNDLEVEEMCFLDEHPELLEDWELFPPNELCYRED